MALTAMTYGTVGDQEQAAVCNKQSAVHSNSFRILKTVSLIFIEIIYGMAYAVLGPSLYDLSRKHDFNYEQLSRAVSFLSLGTLTGSLLTAAGSFNNCCIGFSDQIIPLALTIIAISIVALPFACNLVLLSLLWALQGTCCGVLTTLCISLVTSMWLDSDKTPAVIGALSTACSAGTFLAPLLAAPFVSNRAQSAFLATFSGNITSPPHSDHSSQIHVPFLIIGSLCFLLAMAFLLQLLYGVTFAKASEKATVDLESVEARQDNAASMRGTWYWVMMVVLGTLVNFSSVGRDSAVIYFSATIGSESSLGLSARTASLFAMLINAMRGLGRLTFTIIVHFISVDLLLHLSAVMPMVLMVLLFCFGLQSPSMYYGLLAASGFTSSPTYPLFIGWINTHIYTDLYVSSSVVVSTALGHLAGEWGSGLAYEHCGPHGWFVLETSLAVATVGSIMMIKLLTIINGLLRSDNQTSRTKEHYELLNVKK